MNKYCERFSKKPIVVYSDISSLYSVLIEEKNPCLQIKIKGFNFNFDEILDIVEKEKNRAIKLVFVVKKDLKDYFLKENCDKTILHTINPKLLKKHKDCFDSKVFSFFDNMLSILDENTVLKRIHIISEYKKGDLNDEIFTTHGVENSILIAKNYEIDISKVSKNDVDIIKKYIDDNKNIKPRTVDYIEKHIDNFYFLKIDNINIGIFEIKDLGNDVYELGALALESKWQGKGLGNQVMISIFEQVNKKLLIVTPNEALKKILSSMDSVKKITNSENTTIKKRYQKMQGDNWSDGANREMFSNFLLK